MSMSVATRPGTLFGHPAGLFTLFFAEMWERFSYYGMRALLVFYMLKGFMGYGDSNAYAVYGAYTALVYMTPFFGGMLADRLLGARRAVVLGGLLMAAGHLMMTVQNEFGFFTALALLIAGNGFFKPNISTIVGSLYPAGSPKRDAGFTIFYMGINLGAAMAPLLCGFIGETYGWHRGFGLATIGMLTGVAVFVAPTIVTQVLLMLGAITTASGLYWFQPGDPNVTWVNLFVGICLVASGISAWIALSRGIPIHGGTRINASTIVTMILILVGATVAASGLFYFRPDNPFAIAVNVFVGICLLAAGVIGCIALSRGGIPPEAGAPPDFERLNRPLLGPISREGVVYLGTLLSIPLLALLVSGFSPFTTSNEAFNLIPETVTTSMEQSGNGFLEVLAVFVSEIGKPAGLILLLAGLGAAVYLGAATLKLDQVPRQRMYVVLILTFFSMLFWSFFEQAGSSLNNFTDRNVDRVFQARPFTEEDVGKTKEIQPTQEQLGYTNGRAVVLVDPKTEKVIYFGQAKDETKAETNGEDKKAPDLDKLKLEYQDRQQVFTLDILAKLRDYYSKKPDFTIEWKVIQENVGMGTADRKTEVPASMLQSVNPIYILIFGLVFTALWGFLANRNLEPNTAVKFALGLLQLGLGFGAFWMGAQAADERGMVGISWLFLGYLLQTTGELCLSPVGLAMVTRLSPVWLVSTVMGVWFLATAFSQFLAAIIAQFTGVGNGSGDSTTIPIPRETVHVYGDVFGTIALTAIGSSVICFILAPLLKRWMHEDVVDDQPSEKEQASKLAPGEQTGIQEGPSRGIQPG
jgi:dipeptide/tripeptide permease